MKKNYVLFSIPLLGVVLLLMAYSSGSPGGKSGSPGDGGSTCVQCHTGTPNPVADWITTNIPFTGYVPGNTYTITLTGTHAGVVKFGFEVTAEDGSNSKVGTFILTDPVQTKFTNANNAVTHTSSGNTPSGNMKIWTVDWTAPAAGTGEVGFYAAFNAANGNGGTSGDVIYKTNLFISEMVVNPEISGITPDNANQGETFSATINGSNSSWIGSPAVNLSFSGNPGEIITASEVVATNATTITATFTIPTDASPGSWDVNVDDLTLENGFTVIEVIMSLTSIMPDSATQGDMLTTTIMASNTFFMGSTPEVFLSSSIFPSETIEASSVTVLSDTELEADFIIPTNATAGLWDVNVDLLVLEGGFEVHIQTGLDELSFNNLEIYPNPTDGILNVKVEENVQLSLYDISGNQLAGHTATTGSNVIDLSSHPAGIYFLNIRSENKSEIRKIIIR